MSEKLNKSKNSQEAVNKMSGDQKKINRMFKQVPINFGPMHNATTSYRLTGPCGDTMEFWMMIKDNRIIVATFTTDGCEHSMLCGSSAAAIVTGISFEKFNTLTSEAILKNSMEDIPEENNHCALLALNTMKGAVDKYLKAMQKKANCSSPGSSCGSCKNRTCETSGSDKEQRVQKDSSVSQDSRHNAVRGEKQEGMSPEELIKFRLSRIKNKITVLSGKGGVGKSTVAVNLAFSLALEGYKTGLLDVDIHGPSTPTMLGLVNTSVYSNGRFLEPATVGNLKVMSIGFLLGDQDAAVIWRGPMKMNVIKQFIGEVEWGELDYLIVDCPPGTGDEPLSVIQLLGDPDGAVLVTTPQEVASADVRKSVSFCRQLNLPVLGFIENMSGFACPECGTVTPIFSEGGGDSLSEKYDIPLIGRIPFEPLVGRAGDQGKPFVQRFSDTKAAQEFKKAVEIIIEQKNNHNSKSEEQ